MPTLHSSSQVLINILKFSSLFFKSESSLLPLEKLFSLTPKCRLFSPLLPSDLAASLCVWPLK